MHTVGYKMRTHLAKSLQTRTKAIRNALDKFNIAAIATGQKTLTWTEVSQYSFLEQFTMLRETREDVRTNKWTKPQYRLLMHENRRIRRAKEELQRLNVETRRLHTSIADEEKNIPATLQDIWTKNPLLHVAVAQWWERRRMLNGHLLAGLRRLFSLEGFTGERTPGVRIGSQDVRSAAVVLPPDAIVDDEDLVEHPDDDVPRTIEQNVYNYLSELSRSM